MIIVTGRVTAKPEHLAEVLAIGIEHVHRSRAEPGCLYHSIHQDVEDPLSVTFVERWESIEALRTHFQVPESIAFAGRAGELGSASELRVYEGDAVRV